MEGITLLQVPPPKFANLEYLYVRVYLIIVVRGNGGVGTMNGVPTADGSGNNNSTKANY
jgi:hypothetical protein